MTAESTKRLIVVSNRLPYVLEKQNGDKWSLKPGSGGLVTALLPVLRDRGGVWIGWSGITEEVPGVREIFRRSRAGSRLRARARRPQQGRDRQVLPRLLQRERLAPLPRSSVPMRVRSRVLARLCQGQPQVRRSAGRRVPPRRFRLDPRLPVDGRRPPRARDWTATPIWPSSCTSRSPPPTSS